MQTEKSSEQSMPRLIPTICLNLLVFFILSASAIISQAQDTTFNIDARTFDLEKIYVITRHNGIEYIGKILEENPREILLATESIGALYIPKIEIQSIIEVKSKKHIVNSEFQPEGPFTTRYSFTNNALPIKKGENYGMINLYGPEMHIAATDHLNIGIMTTWIASPLIGVGKYSLGDGSSKFNASIGTMLGTSGYLNGFKGFGGLHWLTLTFGDRKNNLSFSGGYAYLQTGIKRMKEGVYIDSEYYNSSNANKVNMPMIHGPIASIAGIAKIGARYSFVFDSMFGQFNHSEFDLNSIYNELTGRTTYTVTHKPLNTSALFIMPGVRYQKTNNRAFQICVAGVSTFGANRVSFPIPMVNWFFKF